MEVFNVEWHEKSGWYFWLYLDKNIHSVFRVDPNAQFLQWDFEVFAPEWMGVRLKDKTFTLYKRQEELGELVNEGFYELLRQIKNHPEYRLKVLNTLDDQIVEIWNTL